MCGRWATRTHTGLESTPGASLEGPNTALLFFFWPFSKEANQPDEFRAEHHDQGARCPRNPYYVHDLNKRRGKQVAHGGALHHCIVWTTVLYTASRPRGGAALSWHRWPQPAGHSAHCPNQPRRQSTWPP